MSRFAKKTYLSFQAKVIIPVVILLMVFLAVIVWLVNGRLTEQFEEETRLTLTTAEAVFRNSFEIRTRNLILRYQSVANEPRFKAVAQLADSKTMSAQLRELLNEIGPQAQVMTFTTQDNSLLAGATAESAIDLHAFHNASATSISRASSGDASADTILVGSKLFTAVSVPIIVSDSLIGVLTIGEWIGPVAATELKSLTRTEIIFIAANRVVLSTIGTSEFDEHFLSIYNRQKPKKEHNLEAVAAGEEHFIGLAGNFPAISDLIGYVLLSSYETALQRKQETQRTLTLISLAGVLFSSLLMWVLIRKITNPLRKLRDSAEAVGRGDFSGRVEVESNDECGELAMSFNRMTENLNASRAEVQQAMQELKDTQAQLIQTEKLSAMGKFVAGIAHELNNPLTGVIGFSQMLQESGITEKQETYLSRIIGSAERCRRIVQSLLSFSRRYRPERKWINPNDVIESAVEILHQELNAGKVEVNLQLCSDLPDVLMDPHQMQQVFLNIITNAIQATEEKESDRSLRISTEVIEERARIIFQDNGVGISPEDLPNIFNPFFTTKPVGAGTGLGLSLAYGIVREHNGSIEVESTPGSGATFTIDLPVVEHATDDSARPYRERHSAKEPLPQTDQKILVIDDEQEILDLIREALVARGYQVDTVADGNSGITLARQKAYDLVVCDWKMPGSGGQQIYEQIRQMKPHSAQRFVFITGDVLSRTAEQFLQAEDKVCLQKPFSVDEFRTAVERVLNSN